jgi:hypothetical protein
MANITWEIDPVTKDLAFDNEGFLKTVEGDSTSTQNIRMALETWKGDFDLVPDHGTDYTKILVEQADEDTTEEIIREAIFQEDSMGALENLAVEKDENRKLSISFSGQLDNGVSINMEVNAG